MSKRKINHNDLVPWFTEDHGTLPPAYVKSCKKFFDELQAPKFFSHPVTGDVFEAPSNKPQATSDKQ